MSKAYQSLTHSRWNCKYHVVFVPKGVVKPYLGIFVKTSGPSFMSRLGRKHVGSLQGT